MNVFFNEYSDEIQVGTITLLSVVFASIESITSTLKITALLLTIAYTIYKWYSDHQSKKNGNDKA